MNTAQFISLPVRDRLKAAREARGLTVEEVAAACGICTADAIRSYEAGQIVPRDSVKIALADFYRVYLPDLFF